MAKNLKVLFFLVLLGSILFLNRMPTSLEGYASKIIEKCSNEKYKITCYDNEIPKLMDFLSLKQAFDVTSQVQSKDTSYNFCHVLGHKLSARQVQKDSSSWKDIISQCPRGVCSNGCIHGIFQEKFREETLSKAQIESVKEDLKTICEPSIKWSPTGLERGSCYHALGHLTMYITGADTKKSVSLCKEISIKKDNDFSRICFDGVFMQIFQPLEPEDFSLVKGRQPLKENVLSFCSSFQKKEKTSCISESWPLFSSEIKSGGLVSFCKTLSEDERNRCYEAIEFVMPVQFGLDSGKIADFCGNLPKNLEGDCFGNASIRLIETDYKNINSAVELCKKANDSEVSQGCFERLVGLSEYNFKPNSEEFKKFCKFLPLNWSDECLRKAKKAGSI